MPSGWPIRRKLQLGIALLAGIMLTLTISGLRGVYAYRRLAKSLSERASELPLSMHLVEHASALREAIDSARQLGMSGLSSQITHRGIGDEAPVDDSPLDASPLDDSPLLLRANFDHHLAMIHEVFAAYGEQVERSRHTNDPFGDSRQERETVAELAECLRAIDGLKGTSWLLSDNHRLSQLDLKVRYLHTLANRLPSHLHRRMQGLSRAVRYQYRTWIGLMAVAGTGTFILLGLLARCFYIWVFYPLNVLIDGSRRVARGDFRHQIELDTRDEMAGLAQAMNNMVRRFREIRDNLDRQVEERTREVVRSEQMASVGFLAAGVAHEINNPLASIALCAESLEERVHDIIQADDARPDDAHCQEVTILRNYLRMIQDEAFRCKQITERLLDFSRLGDVERQETDLSELVANVIQMIRHVGKYRDKRIEFERGAPVTARVSPQEIKQVVLNLITNGLDSLDAGGFVRIELIDDGQSADLIVTDNGCGMSDEVLQHIFQPFFTRRRDGQGTGLGLSISFRIVEDHGGAILVHSDGPGRGSRFTMRIPLQPANKEQRHLYHAA